MAASPTPEIGGTSPANQTEGGAPGGASPSAPSGAPANPTQMKLASMFQLCKLLAQENPTLSAGLSKAAQGLQEAQTAMLTQPSPQPSGANPPY